MLRIRMKRLLRNGVNPVEVSIVKWNDIVFGVGQKRGSSNCALCEKYMSSTCYECPIVRMNPSENCKISGSTYKSGSYRAMLELLERVRLHQLLEKFGVPDVWNVKKKVVRAKKKNGVKKDKVKK